MNPFHLIKALAASLIEAFRRVPEGAAQPTPRATPLPRREHKPIPPAVKATFAGLLLVLAAGFVVFQFYRSFSEREATWFKPRPHANPILPPGPFKLVREECEREAARQHLPVASTRVLALSDTNGASILWTTEAVRNGGFAPMTQFEQMLFPKRDSWVGYYRLDGTPMRCTLRPSLSQTNAAFVTLHLDQPIAPGGTQLVVRVNKVNLRLRPNRAGNFEVFQGRFPPSTGVLGAAVVLPPKSEWVRMAPISATKKTDGDSTFVYWLNTRTGSNAPPMSVEFRMK